MQKGGWRFVIKNVAYSQRRTHPNIAKHMVQRGVACNTRVLNLGLTRYLASNWFRRKSSHRSNQNSDLFSGVGWTRILRILTRKLRIKSESKLRVLGVRAMLRLPCARNRAHVSEPTRARHKEKTRDQFAHVSEAATGTYKLTKLGGSTSKIALRLRDRNRKL